MPAVMSAAQGIRAVGIDRILRESGVAKASLYKTYGSKDALVIAYLEGLDHADRNRWRSTVDSIEDPAARILTFFDLAVLGGPIRNFRGCQYANAATEFPASTSRPSPSIVNGFGLTGSRVLGAAVFQASADCHQSSAGEQRVHQRIRHRLCR